MCLVSSEKIRSDQGVSDPLELNSCELPGGFWESNPGLVEEQALMCQAVFPVPICVLRQGLSVALVGLELTI